MSQHSVYLLAKFYDGCFTPGPNDQCWEWRKGRQSNGYGVLYDMPKRHVTAHRMALEIKLGRPIVSGMFALHSCDNRACVNPRHLREGTPEDNVGDAIERGRHINPPRNPHLFGERANTAKLDARRVHLLLWDRIDGMPYSEISRIYGVNVSTISALLNGRTWKHLFGTPGFPTLEQVRAVPKNPFRRKHYTKPPLS